MISNVGALGGVKNKEEVKSFFEHVGLYVGLIVYTAAGAKVKSYHWREISDIKTKTEESFELDIYNQFVRL